jgi:hypothetical protein
MYFGNIFIRLFLLLIVLSSELTHTNRLFKTIYLAIVPACCRCCCCVPMSSFNVQYFVFYVESARMNVLLFRRGEFIEHPMHFENALVNNKACARTFGFVDSRTHF